MRPLLPNAALPANPMPMPVLIAIFCLLWSSAFGVAKLALADCPPLLLLASRFLLAGGLMLAAAAMRSIKWRQLARRDIFALIGLGIANNALYLGLNYVGIQSISSGLSALIVGSNPVLTALLAALFLNERMTWSKGIGLLFGVAGVAFIVENRMTHGMESPAGIMFTAAALVSLVGGTILFKWLAPNGGLWLGNGIQNLAGGLALLPFAFSLEKLSDVVPNSHLILAFAYLVLGVSVFGYLLWFHLLNKLGATAASAYHFVMPPLGMLFGWVLLDEHIVWADLAGVIPVAFGIWLGTRPVKANRVRNKVREAAVSGTSPREGPALVGRCEVLARLGKPALDRS